MDKMIALVFAALLLLMYLPVFGLVELQGLALYMYWTLTALAGLATAWFATRRWG